MRGAGEERFNLTVAKATALEAAREWGLELGEPFAGSNVSYVVPAGDAVVKVAWEGDDEALHDADALELWDGDGAVRLLRRSGRALLLEHVVPGDDLSTIPEDEATAIAVGVASRLWRPAGSPSARSRRRFRVGLIGPSARVANSFRSRESCSPSLTQRRTGLSMATSTITTSFAAAGGSSRSIRSRTSLIANTTCLRFSGIRSTTEWRIASKRSVASPRSSARVWTTFAFVPGR